MRRAAFVKAGTRITKNQMSQVIVTALYNLDALPGEDDARVLKMQRRRKIDLVPLHKQAVGIIQDRSESE